MAALEPDFSHRLYGLDKDDATSSCLAHAIEGLATEAAYSLELIADQFTREGDETTRLSDDINYFAIRSVIKTIRDIESIVFAYVVSTVKQETE